MRRDLPGARCRRAFACVGSAPCRHRGTSAAGPYQVSVLPRDATGIRLPPVNATPLRPNARKGSPFRRALPMKSFPRASAAADSTASPHPPWTRMLILSQTRTFAKGEKTAGSRPTLPIPCTRTHNPQLSLAFSFPVGHVFHSAFPRDRPFHADEIFHSRKGNLRKPCLRPASFSTGGPWTTPMPIGKPLCHHVFHHLAASQLWFSLVGCPHRFTDKAFPRSVAPVPIARPQLRHGACGSPSKSEKSDFTESVHTLSTVYPYSSS